MHDCVLLFFVTDKVDATTCKATFQSTDHIELCHGQSNSRGPYSCSGEWRGFVLEQLVIAPRSESYVDCGPFHNNYLYGAQCLRDIVRQRDDFDRAVFDILDKVSGQNQIAKSTVVERFSLERSAQEKDKETDHFPGNSSAFVSFQKKCKPGRLKAVLVFSSSVSILGCLLKHTILFSVLLLLFLGGWGEQFSHTALWWHGWFGSSLVDVL